MVLITCFNDLPDLVLIELFSYLSSSDILWGFTHLNQRLTMLIIEQGFFYHINLSLSKNHQFNKILHFLPLNLIKILAIDSDASPLQLTCWPYLPSLTTLRIIGTYNHDHLLLFLLLHAATLTHLIIKSNERIVPDGFSMKFEHPTGDMTPLIKNILLIHLPALRSLDLGMEYYNTRWPITTKIVPLTYIRICLPSTDILVHLMSTPPLSKTLRQLHVRLSYNCCDSLSTPNPSIPMVNLRIFTLVQTFFSEFTIKWRFFEILISSKIMPVLQRANISLFINIDDLHRINSSSIFTDHRHVDVNFAFKIINCPQYVNITQYIPCGNQYHRREIVGATFVVNHWCDRSQWLIDGDPFSYGRKEYHHMWYTLPWINLLLPQRSLTDLAQLDSNDLFEMIKIIEANKGNVLQEVGDAQQKMLFIEQYATKYTTNLIKYKRTDFMAEKQYLSKVI
ncbi:unnamed protein product [Rotaria sordida]|uniref:F-box domain-containing protein n=2 Tax=Rotaria sordida TaxID=392033 RepID=A0A815Z7X6_9BILA|nr:unnamed protein product [Rotaria sordida]CAF1580531.1 unnamed protein product [Rotaria sordida]